MGAGKLSVHLLRTDTNERAEVLELRGVAAERLPDALAEMEAVASGTRCSKALYHASINTGPGEELTLQQKAAAVARLELALGLEGHARAVVEHRKEGRDHLHVVWSRIDVDTMRAAHDGHNYRTHEAVARELEREFGHNRVQGAHVERDGPTGREPRPPRTPSPGDVQQATRTKRGLGNVAAELTQLWRAADTGPAFAAALDASGYLLAQGDRRGYCVIDQAGGVHSLARRIEGAKTRDVAARLAGIELAGLPTVDQARDRQQDRQLAARERPAAKLAEELTRPADARNERTAALTREDERREQIRADLDRHLRDQVEKRPHAPETGRGEAKASAGSELASTPSQLSHAPPDRRDGPDLQQQLADSAEYRRERQESRDRGQADRQQSQERAASARSTVKPERVKEAGRVAGRAAGLLGKGAGKALGGVLGILDRLFGAAAGAVDSATKSGPVTPAAARPESRPQSAPRPQRAVAPAMPAKTPAPRPPSVFDEIQAKIREREAQSGKSAPPPQPERDRGHDPEGGRSRFTTLKVALPRLDAFEFIQAELRELYAHKGKIAPNLPFKSDQGRSMECRPLVRLTAAIGMETGWIIKAKGRLIDYAARTGASIIEEIKQLDAILYRALCGPT